jgi:hypothetical protein
VRNRDHAAAADKADPRPARRPNVVATRGTTAENRVNLAPAFPEQIVRCCQEPGSGGRSSTPNFLGDIPGALWQCGIVEET